MADLSTKDLDRVIVEWRQATDAEGTLGDLMRRAIAADRALNAQQSSWIAKPAAGRSAAQAFEFAWSSGWSKRENELLNYDDKGAKPAARARFMSILAGAQAAPVAPAEPGWQLVPVEPTQEMQRAAVIYANGSAVYKDVAAEVLLIEESIYAEVWSAMLAAAPQPATAGSGQGAEV